MVKAVQKNATSTQAKRKPTKEKNHKTFYRPPNVYTRKELKDSKICEKRSLFIFNIVVIC
jgi:hypothetical protein